MNRCNYRECVTMYRRLRAIYGPLITLLLILIHGSIAGRHVLIPVIMAIIQGEVEEVILILTLQTILLDKLSSHLNSSLI